MFDDALQWGSTVKKASQPFLIGDYHALVIKSPVMLSPWWLAMSIGAALPRRENAIAQL
jgi:hypothetical protein